MATRQSAPKSNAVVLATKNKTPAEIVNEAVALSQTGFDLNAKALADIADIWFAVRNERLAADKVAAKLKAVESSAEALLLEQFRRQNLTAVGGAKVRVSMDPTPTDEPHVKDWDAFYKYILKTKDFSLLERRPGKGAVKERWADGKEVPGVEKFPVWKLSRNEVK